MVKTKKCVLVGGGFMESQLLFIIPLIHGYCSFKGIEKVIFDFPIPNKVKNNREIKKILCQYEVIELHNKPVFTIKVFCHALFNISFLFYLYFKIKSEGVLKKNSWFNYQIKHSIWDQSIQSSKDGILFPTSLMLLKSTIIVYFAITKIKILVSDKEIDAAFLGHTVYAARAIKAQLEKLGVKIFIHGGETIFLSKGDIKYGDEILDVRKATNLLEQISD
jgi:hypothetical protein